MVLGSLLPNHTVHAYFLGGSSAIRGSGRSFFGSLPCELALATAPDIVLIMLGTNDSKAKVWNLAVYERDLQALALAFARLPSRPRVVLVAPPPLYAAPYSFKQEVINYEVPLALPVVARHVPNASYTLRVFDGLGGPDLACPECFFGNRHATNDGVHPTDYGYHRIADGACEALRDAFGIACLAHTHFPSPYDAAAAAAPKAAANAVALLAGIALSAGQRRRPSAH